MKQTFWKWARFDADEEKLMECYHIANRQNMDLIAEVCFYLQKWEDEEKLKWYDTASVLYRSACKAYQDASDLKAEDWV